MAAVATAPTSDTPSSISRTIPTSFRLRLPTSPTPASQPTPVRHPNRVHGGMQKRRLLISKRLQYRLSPTSGIRIGEATNPGPSRDQAFAALHALGLGSPPSFNPQHGASHPSPGPQTPVGPPSTVPSAGVSREQAFEAVRTLGLNIPRPVPTAPGQDPEVPMPILTTFLTLGTGTDTRTMIGGRPRAELLQALHALRLYNGVSDQTPLPVVPGEPLSPGRSDYDPPPHQTLSPAIAPDSLAEGPTAPDLNADGDLTPAPGIRGPIYVLLQMLGNINVGTTPANVQAQILEFRWSSFFGPLIRASAGEDPLPEIILWVCRVFDKFNLAVQGSTTPITAQTVIDNCAAMRAALRHYGVQNKNWYHRVATLRRTRNRRYANQWLFTAGRARIYNG